GIRDGHVTGVQTCALPIFIDPSQALPVGKLTGAKLLLTGRVLALGDNTLLSARVIAVETGRVQGVSLPSPGELSVDQAADRLAEIGRASCRERGEGAGCAV